MDGPGAKFCLKRGGVGKELEGSVVVGEGGGGRGGDGRTHGGRNLGVVGGGGGVGRLVAGGVGSVVETARGNVSDRSRVAADGSR